MQGTFLDTNIFLRHVLGDVPSQSSACRELFRAIEQQQLTAWTSPQVVAEIVFVLSNPKTYRVPRDVLRDQLVSLLSLPGLKLERKRVLYQALELYVRYPIDYVDAYHAALLGHYQQESLYSFDADFDRLPGVVRRHPPETSRKQHDVR